MRLNLTHSGEGATTRIPKDRSENGWLDPAEQDAGGLAPMLRPFSAERMRAYPVSPWVNTPAHDDARCLEPA
jgi:putative SOS response-associated peptidase YedK